MGLSKPLYLAAAASIASASGAAGAASATGVACCPVVASGRSVVASGRSVVSACGVVVASHCPLVSVNHAASVEGTDSAADDTAHYASWSVVVTNPHFLPAALGSVGGHLHTSFDPPVAACMCLG